MEQLIDRPKQVANHVNEKTKCWTRTQECDYPLRTLRVSLRQGSSKVSVWQPTYLWLLSFLGTDTEVQAYQSTSLRIAAALCHEQENKSVIGKDKGIW